MKALILSYIALLCLSGTPAHGGDHGHVCSNTTKEEMSKKMMKHQDKLLRKLSLTKDQDTRIKEIRDSSQDAIFNQAQKVRGSHTELLGVIEKNAPREDVRNRYSALEKEKQALMSLKLDQMLNIREILTPEQRTKAVAELKEKMNDMCD